MIKILHLYTSLDNGGVESFLFNYYSNFDRNKITFDFVVPTEKIGFLEEKLKNMNCNIYHLKKTRVSPFLRFREINKIMKDNNYDIVHVHGYRAILGLILAKKNNIKIRIMHSHMAFEKQNIIKKMIRYIIVFLINIFATDKFACGNDAAIWLYGKKKFLNNEIRIINNAIDLEKFKYNDEYRKIIRKAFHLTSREKLILNVARLSKQKNQLFLLDVMKNIVKKEKDYKLFIVGDGEDKDLLIDYVKKNELENFVLFLGLRKDINKILSASDIFVLPSLYEGLPVVLAEAQASGIECLVSKKITDEISITKSIKYLPIQNVDEWVNKIMNSSYNQNRIIGYEAMVNSKFDIKSESRKLFDYYTKRYYDVYAEEIRKEKK